MTTLVAALVVVGLISYAVMTGADIDHGYLRTVLGVSFMFVFLAFIRWVSRGIARLIPEGRFKRIMTKQRGALAPPDIDSLRGGLK